MNNICDEVLLVFTFGIHCLRMHDNAYHIEYTYTILNNITSQSIHHWSEGVSRNLAFIEIDIGTTLQKIDSKRFPINKEIAERFTERYLQAITTHRSSIQITGSITPDTR